MDTSTTIEIPKTLFLRMSQALIKVEQIIEKNGISESDWVNEETARALLNCERTKLFALIKSGDIKYKKTGRANTYSRKSIEKYNHLTSS
jgi:hypothetical protein